MSKRNNATVRQIRQRERNQLEAVHGPLCQVSDSRFTTTDGGKRYIITVSTIADNWYGLTVAQIMWVNAATFVGKVIFAGKVPGDTCRLPASRVANASPPNP